MDAASFSQQIAALATPRYVNPLDQAFAENVGVLCLFLFPFHSNEWCKSFGIKERSDSQIYALASTPFGLQIQLDLFLTVT
jgi:hypothetical protein